MTRPVLLLAILVSMAWLDCLSGLKILGVFPVASYSHFINGFRLMKELADRGHEVTFINAYPQKKPLRNLKDISTAGFHDIIEKYKKNYFEMNTFSALKAVSVYTSMFLALSDYTYANEGVQRLLHSGESFDVVVVEELLSTSLMGFGHHFRAPLVLMSAMGPNLLHNNLFGNPAPPSYVPSLVSPYTSHMTFPQRLHNFLITAVVHVFKHLAYYPAENEILHRYLPDAPPLSQIIYNASLILLNSHVSYHDPVPLLPNMIEIGGFHVSDPKPLPEPLKKFLDDARDGAVYFSMGSNLKSADIPAEKREAILKALSEIKQKVLWKFEADGLEDLPQNVKVEKWLPQQDILAHPNVKLFISHGGQLSTIETIYHGVPILGIPIHADQKMNIASAVDKGYAVSLPYSELNERSFKNALKEALSNDKYRESAKLRCKLMHDRPMKPLEAAVYWVEYAARNGGCEHFRSSALDLTWYQLHMIDITIFLALTTIALMSVPYYLIKKCMRGANRDATKKKNE